MTYRQMREKRAAAVRLYLESIEDDTQRLVCFMLMREASAEEICKIARISQERLELVKLQIAVDMRKAGASPEAFRQ